MTGLQGSGLRHEIDGCGEPLYTSRIAFKQGNKTIFEKTGDYFWCRKCRKPVEVKVRQKG